MLAVPCLGPCTSPPSLPPSAASWLNRFCVFSETLAVGQLGPFWVMTSWAAGRPGCSASVPKRVWWLARRCVSRNTLYPNADLIRPDCSPSYFIQNRERGVRGGEGGAKNETKTEAESSVGICTDKARSLSCLPVLTVVWEWHTADRWKRVCFFKLSLKWFTWVGLASVSSVTLTTHLAFPDSHTSASCSALQSPLTCNSSTFNLVWIFA